MKPPAPKADVVRVTLNRPGGRYRAGDSLSARATLDLDAADGIAAVELSVVWYTAGKGDEDLHVHAFRRFKAPWTAATALLIETTLPTSPLSYAGVSVKVCWAVRARVFDSRGRQAWVESPLQLGRTIRPRAEEATGSTGP